MFTNQTFGSAVEALKQGKRVAREGWNGKGMFIFQRPGDNLPFGVIAGVKSLPDSVKTFLLNLPHERGTVTFLPYFCMWAASQEVVNGWLASQTDMLATD